MLVAEGHLRAGAVGSAAAAEARAGRGVGALDVEFARALAGELSGGYRLAGYLLADAAEAQDAVQEASVRAWRGWLGLRDRASFHPWFSQILVNVCRTRLERLGRHPTTAIEAAEGNADEEDPFRAALARDAIGRALPALGTELRLVVVLRYWGELSLAEIAERLNIPLGTVKSRHHAALAALRREIEPAEAGPGRAAEPSKGGRR